MRSSSESFSTKLQKSQINNQNIVFLTLQFYQYSEHLFWLYHPLLHGQRGFLGRALHTDKLIHRTGASLKIVDKRRHHQDRGYETGLFRLLLFQQVFQETFRCNVPEIPRRAQGQFRSAHSVTI